ncbi:hypothetical protein [Blastococcus sp. SYSU D00820]
MTGDRAAGLLAGPRGRRLCWELLAERPAAPVWFRRPCEEPALAERLADAVAATALPARCDADRLLTALAATVDAARYWQGPDDVDSALRDPRVARALVPVAEAVADAPAAAWWEAAIDRDDQHAVLWPPSGGEPEPAPRPAADELRRWRAETVDEERRASDGGSSRWSSPLGTLLTLTTGCGRGTIPIGLSLVEDGFGWTAGRTRRIAVPPGARVYEVTGPGAWIALAARYPLEVTRSRRHAWWEVSGWDGAWVLPDWVAVAADWDAVHVTVAGYLTAAGRALPAGEARTLLAGWHPDATWWLTDVPPAGEQVEWVRDQQEDLDWLRR